MNFGKRCGVDWGVCPDCLGEQLRTDDDGDLCWCEKCRKRWSLNERQPCPDVTVALVSDGRGGDGRVCQSHAEVAKLHVVGCVIRYDDGTEFRSTAHAPPSPSPATPRSNVLYLADFRRRDD